MLEWSLLAASSSGGGVVRLIRNERAGLRMRCTRPSCGRVFGRDEQVIRGPFGDQCVDCLAWLEPQPTTWRQRLEPLSLVLIGFGLFLVGLCVMLLLQGCGGEPFSASPSPQIDSVGGAVSYPTMAQGGAAGVTTNYPAGGSPASTGGTPNGGAAGAAVGEAVECDRSSWMASAFGSWTSGDGGPPSSALDGSSSTRWTSGANQAPGQWFAINLGTPATLASITLRSSRPGDIPAVVTLELDGSVLPASAASSPGVLELRFEPTRTSSVRLVLAAAAADWWSIDDFEGGCE